MSSLTIATVRTFPNKTPLPPIRLRVNAIHDRRTGTGQRGEWSMQRLTGEDFSGDTITVLLTDRDPFPFQKGDTIQLECHNGDKGPSGVYADDDTYKDVTTRQIKVTRTGEIFIAMSDTAPAPAPQQAAAPAQPTQRREEHRPAPAPAPAAEKPRDATDDTTAAVKAARREIVRITNLHALCVLAVDRMEAPLVEAATASPMRDSQRQAAVASIFIKAERQGLVDKMPASPFTPEDFPQG